MRILIVDNDLDVTEFLKLASTARGHSEIDTATTGALAKVIQNVYDLITLDIRMPGATGLEVISPLRNMCLRNSAN